MIEKFKTLRSSLTITIISTSSFEWGNGRRKFIKAYFDFTILCFWSFSFFVFYWHCKQLILYTTCLQKCVVVPCAILLSVHLGTIHSLTIVVCVCVCFCLHLASKGGGIIASIHWWWFWHSINSLIHIELVIGDFSHVHTSLVWIIRVLSFFSNWLEVATDFFFGSTQEVDQGVKTFLIYLFQDCNCDATMPHNSITKID